MVKKMPKKQTILEKHPELIQRLYQIIETGITVTKACAFIGISTSTYFSWMSLGRQETEGIYFEFRKNVLKAEAKCMLKNMMIVQKAAQEGKISAAIWILENRFKMKNSEPEIEVNINLDSDLSTTQLIESLKSSDDLLKLQGPIIDIDEGD